MNSTQCIKQGDTFLGIELGSTRIKSVLIGPDYTPLATGVHQWQNRLEDGIWTYRLEDVWAGVQDCYRSLADQVRARYGVALTKTGAMGISAMMHGYLVFDKNDTLLAPYRTWRNTCTGQAASALSQRFGANIPQRWSIAHLYQAILNREDHVPQIDYMTTLAGYVHWKLSGEKKLGVGDASGMFPIGSGRNDYDRPMLEDFNAILRDNGIQWGLDAVLPGVMVAGECAGNLTENGARLLDPSGALVAGIPLCPPEGDAGTGMVATNSVACRTGNVSAGTSVFAMIVLEQGLRASYPEIDPVTTPDGKPVAMVHCNNCCSDLDAWLSVFSEVIELRGHRVDRAGLYDSLFTQALNGAGDCGGLVSYNYCSGEPITGLEEGRPLFARTAQSQFTLANFMRTLLYSAVATLRLGIDILLDREEVGFDLLLGHGGLFQTKEVGQRIMAAALNTPVMTMDCAEQGGAWGIALLAAYRMRREPTVPLERFLADRVFCHREGVRIDPHAEDVQGFNRYMEAYRNGLPVEQLAVRQITK